MRLIVRSICYLFLVALALSGRPLLASQLNDIEAARARLSSAKSHWEQERKVLERRREAVQERYDKLVNIGSEREASNKKAQEYLEKGQKEATKAVAKELKDIFKGRPSGLGTLWSYLKMTDDLIAAIKASDEARKLAEKEVDETTQATIVKVEGQLLDLDIKIAIYSSFINAADREMEDLQRQAVTIRAELSGKKKAENTQQTAQGKVEANDSSKSEPATINKQNSQQQAASQTNQQQSTQSTKREPRDSQKYDTMHSEQRAHSDRPQPSHTESTRPEPKRTESTRPEPKRTEPTRPEPKLVKATREPDHDTGSDPDTGPEISPPLR